MLKKIIMAFIGTLVKILSGGLATLTMYVDEPVERKNLNLVKWAIANGHLDINTRVVTITSAVVEEFNNSDDTSLVGMISLLKARTSDQHERAISVRFEIPSDTPDPDDDNYDIDSDDKSEECGEEESEWDSEFESDDDEDDDIFGADETETEDVETEETNEETEVEIEAESDTNENADNNESDDEFGSDDNDEDEFGSDEEETTNVFPTIILGKKVACVNKVENTNVVPEMSDKIHNAMVSMVEWNINEGSQFVGVFPIPVFNARDRMIEMASLRKIMEEHGVAQFNVRTDLPQIKDQMLPYNKNCWYFPTAILAEVANNHDAVLRYSLKNSTLTAFIVYKGEVYAPGKGWDYRNPTENVKKLDHVYGKEPFDGLDSMLRDKKLICRTKCDEFHD